MAAALQGLTPIQQFTLRLDASSEEPHAVAAAALQIPHTAPPGGTRLRPLSVETTKGEEVWEEINRRMLGERAEIQQGDGDGGGDGDGVVVNAACF